MAKAVPQPLIVVTTVLTRSNNICLAFNGSGADECVPERVGRPVALQAPHCCRSLYGRLELPGRGRGWRGERCGYPLLVRTVLAAPIAILLAAVVALVPFLGNQLCGQIKKLNFIGYFFFIFFLLHK